MKNKIFEELQRIKNINGYIYTSDIKNADLQKIMNDFIPYSYGMTYCGFKLNNFDICDTDDVYSKVNIRYERRVSEMERANSIFPTAHSTADFVSVGLLSVLTLGLPVAVSVLGNGLIFNTQSYYQTFKYNKINGKLIPENNKSDIADGYNNYANNLLKKKEYNNAVKYYNLAYDHQPLDLYKNNAAVCKATAIHEEAMELHNKHGKENYEAALVKYNQAIALNKNVAVYHNNKAIVLNNLGRAQESLDTAKEALRIDSSYQSAKDAQKKAQDAIDKAAREEVARKEAAEKAAREKAAREEVARKEAVEKAAREEVARKEAIEKAVKEEEAHKKAEEENIDQFLNHLRDGVTCLKEGKKELAEDNFDEALEACNKAEQHFNNAHHQRLLNILSECYINLITLYNEAGDSGAAQALCRKCSNAMFIHSKYASTFEDIYLNMQAANQMQLINFISDMHIHPVEEIEGQITHLIGGDFT